MILIDLLLLMVVVLGIVAVLGLIRFGGRLLLAGAVALALWWWLPLGPGEAWVPWVAAAAVLFSGRKQRGRVRAPAWPGTGPVIEHVPAPSPVAAPATGWAALRRLGDWTMRRRIDAAREACDRYLLLAQTQEDPSAQLPIRLTKHLPTLVDDCVRHCRTATREEQRALVADTVATIEGLAARAETRRVELAHRAQEPFRTLKAHLGSAEE